MIIVSITKFSIVIGSICHVIGVRSRGCPILGIQFELFCNWIHVIGYPCDSHVNYARFNVFLRDVSYSFQNLWKAQQTFSLKRGSQNTFLISKFVIDTSNWTSCRTIQGSNRARNFKSASRYALVRFWNYFLDYPLARLLRSVQLLLLIVYESSSSLFIPFYLYIFRFLTQLFRFFNILNFILLSTHLFILRRTHVDSSFYN